MADDPDVSGVGILLLSLLAHEPSHPYQLFQTLESRRETRLVRVNPGAVYHTVERLEAAGLVAKVTTERAGRRPLRTRYRITERGRGLLVAGLTSFLADDHPAYPLVAVGLAEMAHLPLDDALAALESRRARLVARADWLERATRHVLDEAVPRRHVLELEFETVHVSAELSWLSRIIADLAGGVIPWEDAEGCPPVHVPSSHGLPPLADGSTGSPVTATRS